MTGTIPDFHGVDPVSTDRHLDALTAALDTLDLTDEQRITAQTAYFRSLAVAPPLSPDVQDWVDRFCAAWPKGALAPDHSHRPQKERDGTE